MTNRILAATLLVALTTTTAFAATAPLGGPSMGGPTIYTGGTIDSPGDPFVPETSKGPQPGRSPMPPILCWVVLDENGTAKIQVKNLSGETIDADATVEIVMGNGEKLHGSMWYDWEPGVQIQYGIKHYDGPLTCTATVEEPEDVAK